MRTTQLMDTRRQGHMTPEDQASNRAEAKRSHAERQWPTEVKYSFSAMISGICLSNVFMFGLMKKKKKNMSLHSTVQRQLNVSVK